MTSLELQDNLLTPEAIQDPYPIFAALREHDPVHWSEPHNAWIVSRYDDVVAGFNDPRLSSDRVAPLLEKMSDEKRAKVGTVMELLTGWMVVTDPPAHTRLRTLAANAFASQKVVQMDAWLRGLVDELLDEFVA
jgi:cytochrome P450